MFSKARDGEVVVALSGKWVSWTHTIVAYAAFFGALVTGLYLHYHKIVQNEYYASPEATCCACTELTSASRAIPMNGFLQYQRRLEIDTPNALSSSF